MEATAPRPSQKRDLFQVLRIQLNDLARISTDPDHSQLAGIGGPPDFCDGGVKRRSIADIQSRLPKLGDDFSLLGPHEEGFGDHLRRLVDRNVSDWDNLSHEGYPSGEISPLLSRAEPNRPRRYRSLSEMVLW